MSEIIIVPMNLEHVRALEPQDAQSDQTADERVETARALLSQGPGYAAVNERGVMCLGGVSPQWHGRMVAWVLLSKHAGPHMVQITRAVSRYLDGLDCRRVEMYVDAQFSTGCRWARMLGFKSEGLMRAFLPNGNDAFMYGRTR